MNIAQAHDLVRKVEKACERGDDESAHIAEDDLRLKVLEAIAEGVADAQELAQIAISTEGLKFSRWCA